MKLEKTENYLNQLKRRASLNFLFGLSEDEEKQIINYLDEIFISKHNLKVHFNRIINDFTCNCKEYVCAECAFKSMWIRELNMNYNDYINTGILK
jgi:hypothetical protein